MNWLFGKMIKYYGWQIIVNNLLFLLSIPVAIIAGHILGSSDFYGGVIEALFTELILILVFFIFLIRRISKIKDKEIKLIYSYLSCITCYFVVFFIFWQSFEWLDLFFRILDIILLITLPYLLVLISEKIKSFYSSISTILTPIFR